MKRITRFTLIFILLLSFSAAVFAQNRPFWNEIQHYAQQDSVQMPPKHGIVFVGSSSFRMWKDLETIYKDYDAINRGFGGSTIAQANDYINELVLKYEPRQVVIYSGENDITAGNGARQTYRDFVTFFSNIRKALPQTAIAFVSMKLSPSRTKVSEDILQGNAMIKAFLEKQKNADYIDITSKMLDSEGKLRPELFREDMLHMKPAGYEIWTQAISPHLKKK